MKKVIVSLILFVFFGSAQPVTKNRPPVQEEILE
jgi:hypothetical protein